MVADCPVDYEKLLWLSGELPATDQARVAAHIEACARCAEDVASLRRVAGLLETETIDELGDNADCLDEADIAAWVDGTLDPVARADVLSHVVGCSRCRQEAVSLITTLRSERVAPAVRELESGNIRERGPGPQRKLPRRYRVGAIAAAIAAVLAGVVLLRPTDLEIEETAPHREGLPAAISLPQPIGPLGELETVDAFSWSPVSGADLYKVTLFDDEGTVLWEAETEIARLARPTTVQFERGSQYFWKVVARVGFDRWVDSELVTFTISQP